MRPGIRGQNTLEYAVLAAVIAAAVIAMTRYVRNAVNAHMFNVQEELNASIEEAPAPAP